MKYWAIVVLALYVAVLFFVVLPVIGVWSFHEGKTAFSREEVTNWWPKLPVAGEKFESDQAKYWACLGIVLLAQAALLSVPVNMAQRRPVTKRTIIPLVIASALMMGLLFAGVSAAVVEAVIKSLDSPWYYASWVLLLFTWVWWSWIFFTWSKNSEPANLVERQCKALFKGSVLELLIAVPAHIIVRHRDYCCAGAYTFIGIACGIAVMLFSFGPGVFFLFAQRVRQLNKAAAAKAERGR
jgi:hypothetical protein